MLKSTIRLTVSLFVVTTLLLCSDSSAQVHLITGPESMNCLCSDGSLPSCPGQCPVPIPPCPAGQSVFCATNVSCPPGQQQMVTCASGNPGGDPNSCVYALGMSINSYFFSGPNMQVGAFLHGGSGPTCMNSIMDQCLQEANDPVYPGESVAGEPEGSWRAHGFRTCLTRETGYPGTSVDYALAGYPFLFVNSSCQLQGYGNMINQTPGGSDVCGGILFNGNSSPISLEWGPGRNIREESFVSFPVDPGDRDNLRTWRASSEFPLLVLDPTGSGNITSYEQLFGDWTFGGKKLASLVSGFATRWRDGYEALSTLDLNGDGRIANGELVGLALWFDANRNGVSEPGEVRSLSAVGVAELYFEPDERPLVGDIVATKGFKRMEAGREFIGRSIDWYSRRVIDPLDVLVSSPQDRNEDLNLGEKDSEASRLNQSIAGVWSWSADSNDSFGRSPAPRGTFFISPNSDGSFSVNSVTLLEVTDSSRRKNFALRSVSMIGNAAIGSNKGDTFVFLTAPKGGPAQLRSTVVISDDGASMVGHTEASGNFRDGRSGKIQYNWTAHRDR